MLLLALGYVHVINANKCDIKVNWVWSGALTSTSIRFRVSATLTKRSCDPNLLVLHVTQPFTKHTGAYYAESTQIVQENDGKQIMLFGFEATKLTAGEMEYDVMYQDISLKNGGMKIPEMSGLPFSFKFAFSSCNDEDSDPKVC